MYKHCFLLALEVKPMSVGKVYETLPLHCTLIHRFVTGVHLSELDAVLAPLFTATAPVTLIAGEQTILGPKQAQVTVIEAGNDLLALHGAAKGLLDSLNVTYTAPQWVGEGYRPHVTSHAGKSFDQGTVLNSRAVYLIEVRVPAKPGKRFVRSRYVLTTTS